MTKPNKYAALDSDTFDRILRETINDSHASASEVLQVPGVYELLSEYYNNEVLDRWEEEQAESAAAEDEDTNEGEAP